MTSHAPVAPAESSAGSPARASFGELAFAGVLTAVGIVVVASSGTIAEPLTAGVLGPRAMPRVVGAILIVVGAALLVQLLRGRGLAQDEGGEDVDTTKRTDWVTLGMLVGVLALHIVLIEPFGWPVAATALFGGSAIILGARPWWKALLIGVVVALVVQAGIAGGLGINIPAGPGLENLEIFDG